MDTWQLLLRRQSGVATRAQAVAHGISVGRLRVQVQKGQWQRLFPAVYATFSGPVGWWSRAHAALLYAGGQAALGFEAAAFADNFRATPPAVIDVWILNHRVVVAQPGLRIHRRTPALWHVHRQPPRTCEEQTVLDIAQHLTSADDVVGILTAACRERAVPTLITEFLQGMGRHRWRSLINDMVGEVSDGIESPLEWRFRHHVQQAHGLPQPSLQSRQRVGRGFIRADSVFDGLATRVELDGALAHRDKLDADVWRDNSVAVASSELTLRYRWRHIVGQPCRTAGQVAAALTRGRWSSQPRPCSPGCPVVDEWRQADKM